MENKNIGFEYLNGYIMIQGCIIKLKSVECIYLKIKSETEILVVFLFSNKESFFCSAPDRESGEKLIADLLPLISKSMFFNSHGRVFTECEYPSNQ